MREKLSLSDVQSAVALLKTGFAGRNIQWAEPRIIDRRIHLSSRPIHANTFTRIPKPLPIKKLYKGRVVTILYINAFVSEDNGPMVTVRYNDGLNSIIPLKDLKEYYYQPDTEIPDDSEME